MQVAHWIAGSDYFNRTVDLNAPAESSTPGALIHLAIVYAADNSITLYRNGVGYGASYTRGRLQAYAAGDTRVLFGKRATGAVVKAAPLNGEIAEARLYDRALTAAEIAASFKAGPRPAEPGGAARGLSPAQQQRQQEILTEMRRLRPALADRYAEKLGKASEPTNKPVVPTDLERLQGTWQCVRAENMGKPLPDEAARRTAVITGERYEERVNGGSNPRGGSSLARAPCVSTRPRSPRCSIWRIRIRRSGSTASPTTADSKSA